MRRTLVLAAAGLVTLAAAALWLPIGRWSTAVIETVRAAGPWGVVLYAAIYALAGLTLLPITVFTMGAGFLWGLGWGCVLVFPVAILTALAGFALGRTTLRARVERALAGYPRFAALDRAIGRGGFRLALLVRMSPVIPFGLTNYGLGTTQLGWRAYLGATLLAGLPWTVLDVWMGTAAHRLGDLAGGAPAGYRDLLRWVGLGLAAALAAGLVILSRRALQHELARK